MQGIELIYLALQPVENIFRPIAVAITAPICEVTGLQ